MHIRILLAAWLALAGIASATTLQQLTVAEMIQKSTAIVRAKVVGSFGAKHNGTIYTYYRLQVSENLKSVTPAAADVAVPGGSLGRMHQSVAGAPELTVGAEYVLFLWTGKSGLTQIIGLSQGAFDLLLDSSGQPVLVRPALSEHTVDGAGHTVTDRGMSLGLSDLRSRVQGGSK
ncbi:MAG: hypothetical protein ABI811_23210 [Acidobacteriota bacterium]